MSTVADALRGQAAALRAQAETLDALADAVGASGTAVDGLGWLPASECGLPRTTLRKAIKEGAVASRRVGRATWVRRSDIVAFLENLPAEPWKANRDASRDIDLPDPISRALAAGELRVVKGTR